MKQYVISFMKSGTNKQYYMSSFGPYSITKDKNEAYLFVNKFIAAKILARMIENYSLPFHCNAWMILELD